MSHKCERDKVIVRKTLNLWLFILSSSAIFLRSFIGTDSKFSGNKQIIARRDLCAETADSIKLRNYAGSSGNKYTCIFQIIRKSFTLLMLTCISVKEKCTVFVATDSCV